MANTPPPRGRPASGSIGSLKVTFALPAHLVLRMRRVRERHGVVWVRVVRAAIERELEQRER